MRDLLSDLIKNTIIFEYDLPNKSRNNRSVAISSDIDSCYSIADKESIKKIIYNSIIEYSFNEYDMKDEDYSKLHSIALKTKLKYNHSASSDSKHKYGFYGEVLLFCLLKVILGVEPLIARGYFYNPLENSETKGYDCYHLLERKDQVELWFGEVKFYVDCKKAINSAIGKKNESKKLEAGWKLQKAISDQYLDSNLIAIIGNEKNNLNIKNNEKINKVISDWENNPEIIISEQLKKHDIKFVYPIVIFYQESNGFDNSVRESIDHLNSTLSSINFDITINYSIFFIFVPMQDVKEVKIDVIKWIESKKDLM